MLRSADALWGAVNNGAQVSGSGVLASLADHTELTVCSLAILMVVLSDNTATNLILDRLGAVAMNDCDDIPEIAYSRDNPGERLIWQLSSAILDGLSTR